MKTSSSYMEASIRGAGEALAFLPVGSSIIRAAGACTRAHHQRSEAFPQGDFPVCLVLPPSLPLPSPPLLSLLSGMSVLGTDHGRRISR